MSDATVPPDDAPPKKRSKMPLLIGLVLMLAAGGGGFYAAWSGMILAGDNAAEDAEPAPGPLPDIAFVPIDAVTISLGPESSSRHLRFTAQLEVGKPYGEEVTVLMPRILDVLNSYLRAVEITELENPAAMARIRAQLLRRIQIVTGEGRVRDLLVTEFLLN